MAVDGRTRSAKAALKRKARQEVELRHKVRDGITQMLADLMRWNEIEEAGEALQLLILNADPAAALSQAAVELPSSPPGLIRHHVRSGALERLNEVAESLHGASQKHVIELLILCAHAAGPEGSAKYLRIPRHKIVFSENVSRAFDNESLRELKKNPEDEYFSPHHLK
ncbi:hypothetical protein BLL42_02140 [Pseudomonas frederiksbergensis]|uniref:Uncharacterized protein n=1 Tax=Pseudomonas frederiksbergensis TaxID=104087 RepID=A0A1J0EEW6_9PSED|nr:hypothetical protein [Pseudomonas frederiksbergensis]APC14590.1 hypothetical protein BLL42_02140 [Pseudomonas frederiksbergensis]